MTLWLLKLDPLESNGFDMLLVQIRVRQLSTSGTQVFCASNVQDDKPNVDALSTLVVSSVQVLDKPHISLVPFAAAGSIWAAFHSLGV